MVGFCCGATEKLAEIGVLKLDKTTSCKLQVNESQDIIVVVQGKCVEIAKRNTIIKSLFMHNKIGCPKRKTRLASTKPEADGDWAENTQLQGFESTIQKGIENQGSVRASDKSRGIHQSTQGKTAITFYYVFVLRKFRLHSCHSFIGVWCRWKPRFYQESVSLWCFTKDTALYNRHDDRAVERFCRKSHSGLFGGSDAIRKRRKLNHGEGKSVNALPQNIKTYLNIFRHFGDYTLFQGSPVMGLMFRKRTKTQTVAGFSRQVVSEQSGLYIYPRYSTGGLVGLRHFA